MKYYHPIAEFQGSVTVASAPANNTDVVRKQDAAGLSFISSIAAGSSDLLSVDASGVLSVDSLLISSVTVNNSATSLAGYFTANQAEANGLKEGDFLVLSAATGGTETYITKTQPGSGDQIAGNLVEVESGLTSAEIVAKLSDGDGIDIAANGQISVDIIAGAGINKTASNGQITLAVDADSDEIPEGSTNLYHTTARAQAAITGSGDATVANGVVSVTTYKSSNFNNDFGAKSTADLSENAANQYHTTARVRAAVSAGGDLTYSAGQFSVTTYKAADFNSAFTAKSTADLSENAANLYFTTARAQSAITGGDGIVKSIGSLAIDLKATDSGLDLANGKLSLDWGKLRYTETTNLVANTWKTISHGLGKAPLHVTCYDSTGNMIRLDVKKGTGADALNEIEVKSISAISSAEILVGI